MTEISKIVIHGLDFFLNKSIIVRCGDFSTQGVLTSVKNKDYFYELIIKTNRYKKKVILFYPFDIKFKNKVLSFDYRLNTLSKRVPLELLYNLCNGKELHPFMNKIVHICE